MYYFSALEAHLIGTKKSKQEASRGAGVYCVKHRNYLRYHGQPGQWVLVHMYMVVGWFFHEHDFHTEMWADFNRAERGNMVT